MRPMKLRTCITTLPVLLFPFTLAVPGCGGTPVGVDMGTTGRALKNLPTGCPATETSDDLYSTLVKPTCATPACHVAGNQLFFSIGKASDLHDQWVGKTSSEGGGLPDVTASNLDKSFLMYKITGQQTQAEGARMPNTGVNLTDAQICKFIAWIKGGAT